MDYAKHKGIPLTTVFAKDIVQQCPVCQKVKKRYSLHKLSRAYGTLQTMGLILLGWASQQGVYWVFLISYYPQATGLTEYINGLLKQQVKLLAPTHKLRGVEQGTVMGG
ncbi:hypothetical protein XELAEV_18024761mg [Xenopus laevis]|uniref:Integrase catalytic domain-containing protein n=1 Tax=Xenopus laevis TaxID=8355 RepID=A0A974CYC4_XENLA|nr:hypothetical protein XELAEV_18024761mg [Xenopus laevis]